MKTIKLLFVAFLTLCFSGAFASSEKATKAEAEAMAKKAVVLIKSAGKEAAYKEFQTSPKFKDRDLYVYVINETGIMQSHGANEKLIGKDVSTMKDDEGKFFVKAILEKLKKENSGWEDYRWPNPLTKQYEDKTAYFEKVGDVIVVCGIYR